MRLLVTAGNTQAPIDRVRCITNIFTGRTGAGIAVRAWERGHTVTLLTSHPEVASGPSSDRWTLNTYRTFGDLRTLMATQIPDEAFDAIIHCAAVSDYLCAGVYESDRSTPVPPAGKLKSDAAELWLRLVRAPKLIDSIRNDWGFRGTLVKFKLEVDVSDDELLEVAERSRRQSQADLMAANTLEGAAEWAFLGPITGRYERVSRSELPDRLLDAITSLQEVR
jgi:phosphopantothenoylcysteine synthetase/decarboxylase